MNSEIESRWNETVGKFDTVYFLGDLVFPRDKGSNIREWLHRLNGRKIFIWGNHDRYLRCKHPFLVLPYNGEPLLLVHCPDPDSGHNKKTLADTGVCELLEKWKDTPWWIIHGHHHNNSLGKYPLINNRDRMINVSAELLDYRPVELKRLLAKRDF
jgi:calcineurin-like phosphoesterase family protein